MTRYLGIGLLVAGAFGLLEGFVFTSMDMSLLGLGMWPSGIGGLTLAVAGCFVAGFVKLPSGKGKKQGKKPSSKTDQTAKASDPSETPPPAEPPADAVVSAPAEVPISMNEPELGTEDDEALLGEFTDDGEAALSIPQPEIGMPKTETHEKHGAIAYLRVHLDSDHGPIVVAASLGESNTAATIVNRLCRDPGDVQTASTNGGQIVWAAVRDGITPFSLQLTVAVKGKAVLIQSGQPSSGPGKIAPHLLRTGTTKGPLKAGKGQAFQGEIADERRSQESRIVTLALTVDEGIVRPDFGGDPDAERAYSELFGISAPELQKALDGLSGKVVIRTYRNRELRIEADSEALREAMLALIPRDYVVKGQSETSHYAATNGYPLSCRAELRGGTLTLSGRMDLMFPETFGGAIAADSIGDSTVSSTVAELQDVSDCSASCHVTASGESAIQSPSAALLRYLAKRLPGLYPSGDQIDSNSSSIHSSGFPEGVVEGLDTAPDADGMLTDESASTPASSEPVASDSLSTGDDTASAGGKAELTDTGSSSSDDQSDDTHLALELGEDTVVDSEADTSTSSGPSDDDSTVGDENSNAVDSNSDTDDSVLLALADQTDEETPATTKKE